MLLLGSTLLGLIKPFVERGGQDRPKPCQAPSKAESWMDLSGRGHEVNVVEEL